MDKVLRLYNIPEQDVIVGVIRVYQDDTLPSPTKEGDLLINYSIIHGWRLYNCVTLYGELDWVDVPFDTDAVYLDTHSGAPEFYIYNGSDVVSYSANFPQSGRIAELYDFTYSASRMGGAPTISATLWYDTCLDELWTDRVCVFFNGGFFFLDKTPSSEYSNADSRYKHSLSYVSDKILLEKIFFENVVDASTVSYDDVSMWLEFSFFGDISQFVSRLNQSMIHSGLDALGFNIVIDSDVLAMTFDEPEKLISISDTTIKGCLDMIYELWGVPYYFDGYTAHIGFSNAPQMSAAGVTMPTFRYGAEYSLLSITKNQNNDIVNRMAGFGASDNLPYFYPNKNPKNLDIQYIHNDTLMLDYAKIVNPYRLVGIEPSEAVHQGVPSGTYFKYMPITGTWTYDQFVTINPNYARFIQYNGDEPELVVTPENAYECRAKYYNMLYGGTQIIGHTNQPEYTISCKTIWMWLQDGDLNTLTMTDEMEPESMIDYFPSGNVSGAATYYIKAKSHSYSRSTFENLSENSESYNFDSSADLIDRSFHFENTNQGNKLRWNDNTLTDTYNEIYPIIFNTLPTGTTCISFTVGVKIPYNAYWADSDEVLTKLKTDTQFVAVQVYEGGLGWSMNASGTQTNLYSHGIRLAGNVTPVENDIIYFEQNEEAKPYIDKLLPSNYRLTGDMWLNATNNTYTKENNPSQYYSFENQYKLTCAREAVETFDDIKPTIKGMTNNETPAVRIDKFIDITFDANDNNEVNENGEYYHPYFYVKLAKTSMDNGYGFNLFDCALEGSVMQFSMTSGECGGCAFDVMVKYRTDGRSVNTIAVFEEDTTIDGVTYLAGTPKRNTQTGDVLTNQYQESQQYTDEAEVWIALKKDNETFSGETLPNSSLVPTTSDTFVILNINMPYAYITAAEQKLYYAILDKLEEDNVRKWSFSIRYSSIYYGKNYELMDKWLNESALVPFIYNSITRQYYVQSYTYKMTNNATFPSVSIELQEKLRKKHLYNALVNIIPVNNAIALTEAVETTEKKLKKTVKNELSAQANTVESRTFENLEIQGDITLKDGTSLNAQIVSLNDQIFSNQKIRTREYTWGEISKRAEAENLFKDGLFRISKFNSFTIDDAAVRDGEEGALGSTCKIFVFSSATAYVLFDQQTQVEPGLKYTLTFFAKAEPDSEIGINLNFYDSENTLINDADEHTPILIPIDWEQQCFVFTAPDDASYARIIFKNISGGTDIVVYVDGMMLFQDNYMTYNESGALTASTLLPNKYKLSNYELLRIGEGGGEANVQANWSQTDTTADDYIKNKPTIPSATSDLTNDSGFITANDIPAQVNADWDATTGVAVILNKPSIPDSTSDLTNDSGFITASEVSESITTLTSPVRIWSLDDGVYLLPSSCRVYYKGASDTSSYETAAGLLVVYSPSETTKSFFVISEMKYGASAWAPWYFITGYSTATSGSCIAYDMYPLQESTNIDWTSDMLGATAATIKALVDTKQNVLVSGTNIKTVNGESILGSGDLEITTGVSKHIYLNNKVIGTRLQGNVYVNGAVSDLDLDNGETIPCAFGYDVNAGDSISIYDTSSTALVTNASIYYQNAAITTGIIKAGDWALLIYNSTNNIFMVIATSAPRYTKTINGSSVVGSGDLETENWQTIVTSDGDTTETVTPSVTYTCVFVDNSSNTSDFTLSVDTTGIATVFEEYDSLVVNAGLMAKFEIRKFTSNNVVYASIKKTMYSEPNYGVAWFRAETYFFEMIRNAIDAGYYNSIPDYLDNIDNNSYTEYKPDKYVLDGTITLDGVEYYKYNPYAWINGNYENENSASSYAYILIPKDFAFKKSNCAKYLREPSSAVIRRIVLTTYSGSTQVYYSASDAEDMRSPFTLVDFGLS